ncbi:MAG TPA: glycerol-3-phosphate dehydrogenase [Caldimonas sp.]|nr:glycerol-3-phosphate dehydrogenase [Caldimonas sp.]
MNPSPANADAAASGNVESVDVLVVGGGINGAGIARDLAGRGASVLLCEQDDLANHTSSASTKLIHGGLRYLEYREFGLVRKALAEREVLLKAAPHIMRPLSFVMPHDPSMRPAWMIRAGLFLYDHLAHRDVLPASRGIDLRRDPVGAPLQRRYTRGFMYADGWVDDARLVVLCAVDAAERGARVETRMRCVDARPEGGGWHVRLAPHGVESRPEQRVRARVLVNAAGPWAAAFLKHAVHRTGVRSLRLVKGSHIVVPRLHPHPHAYIFQNADGRIIFAIPFEGRFTLIGTTDVEHHGAIGDARIDTSEIEYLCAQASRYFERPVTPDQVIWTYSGVRPLLDDEHGNPAAVTRDYRLELDESHGAPLLSVWGGKLTTFRKLAEEAADRLVPVLRVNGVRVARGDWTAEAPLPGGDIVSWLGSRAGPAREVEANFDRFVGALADRHPDVARPLVYRLARAYGTRAAALLETGLGEPVAPPLHATELRHLIEREWARSADDVLWRRSKLGLHLDAAGRAAVATWLERAPANA